MAVELTSWPLDLVAVVVGVEDHDVAVGIVAVDVAGFVAGQQQQLLVAVAVGANVAGAVVAGGDDAGVAGEDVADGVGTCWDASERSDCAAAVVGEDVVVVVEVVGCDW